MPRLAQQRGKERGGAGDDLTGKVISTVSPPHGLHFMDVQGTSDDRTFLVTADGQTTPPGMTGAPAQDLEEPVPGGLRGHRVLGSVPRAGVPGVLR
jgi:hypothetical protein